MIAKAALGLVRYGILIARARLRARRMRLLCETEGHDFIEEPALGRTFGGTWVSKGFRLCNREGCFYWEWTS